MRGGNEGCFTEAQVSDPRWIGFSEDDAQNSTKALFCLSSHNAPRGRVPPQQHRVCHCLHAIHPRDPGDKRTDDGEQG